MDIKYKNSTKKFNNKKEKCQINFQYFIIKLIY